MEKHEQKGSDRNIAFLCVTLALLILLIDSWIPLGVAGGVPYILVILLSLWFSQKKYPYYVAMACSILTVAGFYVSPPGGTLWQVLFNRFLALFAIWTTAVLGVQRQTVLEQREKALLQIKILGGLLPICASCKKIRDDRGYWNQLEAYIRDHSEAEFSHGICPECAKKLYPDIDIYNDNRTHSHTG